MGRIALARPNWCGAIGMNSGVKCVFCGTSTPEVPAAESAWVHSDVMEFSAEAFTVWRCAKRGSPDPFISVGNLSSDRKPFDGVLFLF